MPLCIDTSVWINANEPTEPRHGQSRLFIDYVLRERPRIFAPNLMLAEVAGTIRRTRGDSALSLQFVSDLVELPFVQFVPIDHTLALLAATLASKHSLRGADSIYAAVALQHQCDLISLDTEHLTRLNGIVATSTPSEILIRLNTPPS